MALWAHVTVLRIDFSLRGINGHIDASISENDDPAVLGYLIMSYGSSASFVVLVTLGGA